MMRVTTLPTTEPLDMAIIRQYCSIDGTEHDALLTILSKAARSFIEQRCGLAVMTQTITERWALDGIGGKISVQMQRHPVQAITAVRYRTDTSGDWTAYTGEKEVYDYAIPPGAIIHGDTIGWREVEISYTAGYTAADQVPDEIKAMILLRTCSLHSRRTEEAQRMDEILTDMIRAYRQIYGRVE